MSHDRKLDEERQRREDASQWANTIAERTEDAFLYALSSNNAWAGYKGHQNPNFFPKLASGQSPQIRKSRHSMS
jgi:hypothetical protein